MTRIPTRSVAMAVVLAVVLASSPGTAQPAVEPFYKGRTIDLIVGFPPGGSNDVFARFVGRYLGRYIPGNPTIVMRNMPGGGSLLAANHVFMIAPKDGSVIAIVSPTAPLDARLGNTAVRFEPEKFNWLGRISASVNPVMIWHTQPFKTFEDALKQEITLAATGAGSTVSVYPTVANNVLRTRFKLVMGYKGSGEAMLAMERGETAGHSTTWEALKTQHPGWITDRKVNIILQFAITRHPEMKDVPTALEVARTDEQRAILRAVLSATEVGKALFTAPGVPAERVEALRRAFDRMVLDAEFKAEFDRAKVDLEPRRGEEVQALVEELARMPPDLLAKVKAVYGG